MKQRSQSLVLLGALVLTAGGLWLYVLHGIKKPEADRNREKAAEAKLLNLPSSTGALRFHAMTVNAQGETTVLERAKDDWNIVSPVQTKADAFIADAIATQIQTARLRRVVEENPSDADLERYGLKHPHFTVKATVSSPDAPTPQEVVYQGGVENPFDGSVYLRKSGDPRVYSAEGGLRWTFDKSTFDLRDKEHFRFEESKVETLWVKAPKLGGYRVEKDASKGWTLTAPLAADADPNALSSMLAVLRAERALAYVDPGPGSSFSWDAPLLEVQLTFDGKGVLPPLRFRFLKRTEEGTEKVYALREQGKEAAIAQVSLKALEALNRPPADLKDKTVLRIKRDEIARIIFKPAGNGENALIVEKASSDAGAQQWQVLAPRPGPAQALKIAAALWTLEGIKATHSGEEAPKRWSDYGISAQSRTIELANNSGQVLARLQMGKAVPDKPYLIYVRGTRNQVLEVESAKLADLPNELGDVESTPR